MSEDNSSGFVNADSAKAPASAAPPQRRLVALASVAAVAAAVGAGGLWLVQARTRGPERPPNPQIVFTIDPPPGLILAGPAASTSVAQLAISPDGRYVVFVAADAEGRSSLWARALDTLELRQLPGTDGAKDPFWSPDSRRIGFFSQGVLKLTEVVGTAGSPRSISRAPADSRGGAWHPDGTSSSILGGRLL